MNVTGLVAARQFLALRSTPWANPPQSDGLTVKATTAYLPAQLLTSIKMLGIHCRAIGIKAGRWQACQSSNRSKMSLPWCASSAKSGVGHRKNSRPNASSIGRMWARSNEPKKISRLEHWISWQKRYRSVPPNFSHQPANTGLALRLGVVNWRKPVVNLAG